MPKSSFNAISERLTKALLTGDFDLYQTVMQVPLRVEPRKGQPYELLTIADLEKDFRLYCASLQAQGVTDIFREKKQLVLLEDDWVEVTFVTNILRNAERVVEPFKSQFVLRPREGEWRIAEIRSSLGHINWTLGTAAIESGHFSED